MAVYLLGVQNAFKRKVTLMFLSVVYRSPFPSLYFAGRQIMLDIFPIQSLALTASFLYREIGRNPLAFIVAHLFLFIRLFCPVASHVLG